MRVELQPAYILHTRPYRNTSMLLDVFTRDYGIIALVAKGVRRPGNARRVLLQPFMELRLSYSGRSELMTLIDVEPAGNTKAGLTGSALYSGFYVNELLQRLLHRHDPHESLFEIYKRVLDELAAQGAVEVALRRFELKLLGELGYALQLEWDDDSDAPVAADRRYFYDIERGPVRDLSSGIGADVPTVGGDTLLALAAGRFDDARTLAETKRLMRYVLNHYLGGRALKSRELFGGAGPVSSRGDND